uniref:Uncharacterized protein n=1 Tax=Lactuca sativa TaxID=4236 RepID=A0A9R1XYC9_LACSA|nr:hypothetical protein LSAT_V11C100020220 [Lactuca sativa]
MHMPWIQNHLLHPPKEAGSPSLFSWNPTTMAGLTLAAAGWSTNIIVYLINEFNIKSIDAAQIANIVNGCTTLLPILGAILADSFFGSFTIILVSSLISLAGILLLTLTATLDPLKPAPCENGSELCVGPSKRQLVILYMSVALSSIGLAGTRFTLATMGADQFDNPKDQGVFFNWHFFTLYVGILVSVVGIIYVEDNMSWGLGYGLCVAANLIGLVIFAVGRIKYQLLKPQASPFTRLACVVVAAFRNRKLLLSLKSADYCQEPYAEGTKLFLTTPTNSLNRILEYFKFLTNLVEYSNILKIILKYLQCKKSNDHELEILGIEAKKDMKVKLNGKIWSRDGEQLNNMYIRGVEENHDYIEG